MGDIEIWWRLSTFLSIQIGLSTTELDKEIVFLQNILRSAVHLEGWTRQGWRAPISAFTNQQTHSYSATNQRDNPELIHFS